MTDFFARDLRQAIRRLMRAPGFTAVTVITLGLGTGAATAIYTLLQRVVLDPLPYPQPERLVRLTNPVPGVGEGEEWDLSLAQYVYYGDEAISLEEIGAYSVGGVNLEGPGGPQRARSAQVTAGMLRLLGAAPAVGRMIGEDDDRPDAVPVAMLSYGFWRREFGGDATVVGRTIRINEQPTTVIGVMEPGIEPPSRSSAPGGLPVDVWLPYRLPTTGPFYNNHVIPMIARLAPDATIERAQAELDRLVPRLPDRFPSAYGEAFLSRYGFRTTLRPLAADVVGEAARNLWILFGAVGLVLVIAFANTVNLFLVRAEGRRREVAVRTALGAGTRSVARLFLAEALVLALTAGIVAVLLALWSVEWVIAAAPSGLPRLNEIRVDFGVVLFAVGLSVLLALALAAFPTLRLGRRGDAGPLAGSERAPTAGRDRQRVRAALVVAQVALALVLVAGAGLLIQSFQRLRAQDPGIAPDGVLTMEMFLPSARYRDHAAAWSFYRQVLDRVRALPGVTEAGLSTALPFADSYGCTVQGFEDPAVYERIKASGRTTCAGQSPTSTGYFEALGIPVVRGRTFRQSDFDQPATGAVVVSEAFAERFWPGEDPIGKGVAPSGNTEGPFYHVIGVVGDVYGASLEEPPAIAIYYPMTPIPDAGRWYWINQARLVVETELDDPSALFPAIRRAAADVDPSIPIANLEEMTSIVERSLSRRSFTMALLSIAAAVALLLAAVGLYGVLSYAVRQRRSEIGIRMALGARREQVSGMVLRQSLSLALIGVAIGVAASLALTRVLAAMLFGVTPSDPVTLTTVSFTMIAVALVASYLPARRAAMVDPADALRAD